MFLLFFNVSLFLIFFFFFFLNKKTLLKIKTLENFQTELKGNQVDYTTKLRTLQQGRQK